MLEKRMEEVEENVRMFGSAPADNTLLSNLQERIDKLNKKLVALGGKPIKREGGDRGPVPTARQKGEVRPIGREAAKRIVEETAGQLAERMAGREHESPAREKFGVVQGGRKEEERQAEEPQNSGLKIVK